MSGIGAKMILVVALILVGGSNVDGSKTGDYKGPRRSFFELWNQYIARISPGKDGKNVFIFPGTLWCGIGNRAQNDGDRGLYKDTDNCCHDHDTCSGVLRPSETLHFITNDGEFDKRHCTCDQRFYNCLRKVNSPVSWIVGEKFFTKIRPQCYAKTHPVTECIETVPSILGTKCLKWKEDTTRTAVYQWFDNPDYHQSSEYHNHVHPKK